MLYWSGKPYLGLGPSAHSFDGDSRSWNVSSLKTYMELLASGKEIRQTEELTVHERYHDYLITSLRTRWGADPDHIEHSFGAPYRRHFEKQAQVFIESGSMVNASGSLIIEPGQWMITDHILRALFMA
jgi:oxygen-independent coproporphyrinogen-3 oxidase